MNGMAPLAEFGLTCAGMMLVLLGLAMAVLMPSADRWNKRFFITVFTVLTLYVSLCLTEGIVCTRPGRNAVREAFYYFETLSASLMVPMITVFLLRSCGEPWQRSVLFYAVTALWAFFFIALNLSPFTDWFYSITPENQYVRGPLYSPAIAFLAAGQILDLFGVIRRRNRLSRRYFYAFLISLFPMTAALLIHLFVSALTLFAFGMAVCALSMFGFILFDQIDRMMLQQREIAHQQASIMLLQMRPHFIYNTMMSIYYLCKQDPDLAQRVTLDFTTYLRKNFTAIASEDLIPFSEELEHTRAYLAVEQAQFEDRLFIEYDTPHVDFRLPPLTLQPIVENAVKHGMDPDAEPLTIRIRTAATDKGSEIVVEDTGTGFEPPDAGEPHIALKNIRQRLEIMCRGTMTIAPGAEGGTTVRVIIP